MDYSKFRTLRIGQNLTQLECSEKLGVDKKTVQNWEQGKNAPTPALIPKIASLFFKSDMDALNAYFGDQDTPARDFSSEIAVLTQSLQSGNVSPALAEPLRWLLNADVDDAEIRALSAILGSLQCTPMDCTCILGELVAIVQAATTIRMGAETESLDRDLIRHLEHIKSNNNLHLPNERQREIEEIIVHIKNARLSDISFDRLIARRRCLYWLSDNYEILKNCRDCYYALSSTIIPLGGTPYVADARRHLFYALLPVAERLNQLS